MSKATKLGICKGCGNFAELIDSKCDKCRLKEENNKVK